MKKESEDLSATSEFVERIIAAADKKTAETLITNIQETALLRARKSDTESFDTCGSYSFACSGGQQCSGGVDSGTDSDCTVQTCPRLACDRHNCGTVSCGAVV